MQKLDLPAIRIYGFRITRTLKFEQLKSKVQHPQKCIKILGKLENLQVFFYFFQRKWWNKNLEIIYEENPISENPKPRKIKTIYNLILKKINVGNKLHI